MLSDMLGLYSAAAAAAVAVASLTH